MNEADIYGAYFLPKQKKTYNLQMPYDSPITLCGLPKVMWSGIFCLLRIYFLYFYAWFITKILCICLIGMFLYLQTTLCLLVSRTGICKKMLHLFKVSQEILSTACGRQRDGCGRDLWHERKLLTSFASLPTPAATAACSVQAVSWKRVEREERERTVRETSNVAGCNGF